MTTENNLSLGHKVLSQIDELAQAREEFHTQRESNELVRTRSQANHVRLVAEGDSWFDFKIHADVIDWLESEFRYHIVNQAKAGACLYEMAYGIETSFVDKINPFSVFGKDETELELLVQKIRKHKPNALLLSGGGNDFVGPEFILTLHHALAEKNGPNLAVVRGLFEQELAPAYQRIIETASATALQAGLGELPIFTHGYAYPYPDGRAALNLIVHKIGPWMEPSFEKKGYRDKKDAGLQMRHEIVRPMIDCLYEMLHGLARRYPNLTVIDLRNTLTRHEDWADELHPTRQGFYQVALEFHKAIYQKLPSSNTRASTRSFTETPEPRVHFDEQILSPENFPPSAPNWEE